MPYTTYEDEKTAIWEDEKTAILEEITSDDLLNYTSEQMSSYVTRLLTIPDSGIGSKLDPDINFKPLINVYEVLLYQKLTNRSTVDISIIDEKIYHYLVSRDWSVRNMLATRYMAWSSTCDTVKSYFYENNDECEMDASDEEYAKCYQINTKVLQYGIEAFKLFAILIMKNKNYKFGTLHESIESRIASKNYVKSINEIILRILKTISSGRKTDEIVMKND